MCPPTLHYVSSSSQVANHTPQQVHTDRLGTHHEGYEGGRTHAHVCGPTRPISTGRYAGHLVAPRPLALTHPPDTNALLPATGAASAWWEAHVVHALVAMMMRSEQSMAVLFLAVLTHVGWTSVKPAARIPACTQEASTVRRGLDGAHTVGRSSIGWSCSERRGMPPEKRFGSRLHASPVGQLRQPVACVARWGYMRFPAGACWQSAVVCAPPCRRPDIHGSRARSGAQCAP